MISAIPTHEPCHLTLRQAYKQHYLPHADHLSPHTKDKYKTSLGHWEEKTGNPELADVTNATVADFRRKMIDAPFAPATINTCWGQLRAIFRHLGPQEYRNPFGLGILHRVPAMKRVREDRTPPYRIPLDDLDRTYRAADSAVWPRSGIPAPDLWRTLLVLAYVTGLRRNDLKSLTWDRIDLRRGEINVRAGKTGKADVRRLHPCAVKHLERVYRPTEQVFYGLNSHNGRLYGALKRIQRAGRVSRPFTLQDIRRTGGSEVDRIHKGVGPVYLQHVPMNVSDMFYLSRIYELNEAVLQMQMPPSFTGEIPHVDLEPLPQPHSDDPATAEFPQLNRGEWEFRPGAFRLGGRWFSIHSGVSLSLLQVFAFASRPLSVDDIGHTLNRPDISRSRISTRVSDLRDELCLQLRLRSSLDPLPLVQTRPAAWALYLPAYVLERIEAQKQIETTQHPSPSSLPFAGIIG